MTYYIELNNQIVLFDTNREKLESTLKFMPQYAGLEIKETQRPIENFEFADTPQYLAQKQHQKLENQVTALEAATGLIRPLREIILAGNIAVGTYVQEKVQEIETLCVGLRNGED
ncbi:MAG: hypothetical protein MJ053_03790 [Elusimicrobiaceae bacterium]|nr:hypothetical protein [Elusimicrobiaceae bacterium]